MKNDKPLDAAFCWKDETISRVMLGTAQLGLEYGIANTGGKPDRNKAAGIIKAAWEEGVRYFDTAQAYGNSEQVLGEILGELGLREQAAIISKISLATPSDFSLDTIESRLCQSLEYAGGSLWALLLHSPDLLTWWDTGLGALLKKYRDSGRIRHLGVSLSSLQPARQCMEHPDLEIIQLPCNAWDRRPLKEQILSMATRHNKLCCIRSLYLQGLLVLSPEAVRERLAAAYPVSMRWNRFLREHGLEPAETAIRFGAGLDFPLVVGADSAEQIRETAHWLRKGALPESLRLQMEQALGTIEDTVLEPWRWPTRS